MIRMEKKEVTVLFISGIFKNISRNLKGGFL